MNNFEFFRPGSVHEALRLLEEYGDDAKLLAGGQSLLILMREGLVQRKVIIGVAEIEEMKGIRLDQAAGVVRIGAATIHRDVETSPLIAATFPMLSEAYPILGSVQVRNFGTLGGNLCHNAPGSDPPSPLIALGATLTVEGPGGKRTVCLEDFGTGFYETSLGSNEMLTEVQVPLAAARSAGAYHKYAMRANDMPFVNVAAHVTLDAARTTCTDVRIVLGGVASTTIRARQAEALLSGKRIADDRIADAGQAAAAESDPISDTYASAEYRRQLVPVAVRRTVAAAVERARAL